MDATDLTSGDYWESESVDIRLNPKVGFDTTGLEDALEEQGIASSVVLATSGRSKLVVLSKRAMLCSANAVNQWCGVTQDDIWLGGLSTFHVGGLGIYSRAFLTGSKVNPMAWNQWTRDGAALLSAMKDTTITSLTPVHLYDLVSSGVQSPECLRGVFIGGGALSRDLAEQALDLGWPLWTTYGMTEACSQIATSLSGDLESLPVLPHWEVRASDRGQLEIKGAALMDGYLTRDSKGGWTWHGSNGFFTTGDLGKVRDGKLYLSGRADDQVKILGELVSLEKLELSLSDSLDVRVVILASPDSRRGVTLIAVIESEPGLRKEFGKWNDALPPFERVGEVNFIDSFPRTESGKIDRAELTRRFLPS